MRTHVYMLLASSLAASLLISGYSQAANVEYPTKGKTITAIVPSSAGGGSDTIARAVTPLMEKDLGTPIQIVNKPGAGMQIGLTGALASKPDGYNLVWTILPTTLSVYLDPDRHATFGRKDIHNIALVTDGPFVISVLASSPYKALKDLIDAAKANPYKIKIATTGYLSTGHLGAVELQRVLGVRMAPVHFEGGGPALTALLGGHVDVSLNSLGEVLQQNRAGTIRIFGTLDKVESRFLPGVKTLESQGYKVYVSSSVGLSAPTGIPNAYADILAKSVKKAMENEDFKKFMENRGETLRYLDPAQYAAYCVQNEALYMPLIEIAKKDQK
jgi:tripartite-type tricarboxylate transporter receptor subunit TctC